MTRFCLVSGFRNKEKSGSQPACLDHMQDRKALALKAHQSESHLPIGRCVRGYLREEGGSVTLGALGLLPPEQTSEFEEWGGSEICLVWHSELSALHFQCFSPITSFQSGHSYPHFAAEETEELRY